MFMPRSVSSTKPIGQSIGTISFNTRNDEDITGLDEAMETFRISAVTNGVRLTFLYFILLFFSLCRVVCNKRPDIYAQIPVRELFWCVFP